MDPLKIFIAEDNDDHAEMIIDALEEHNPENQILRFINGELLISYLEELTQGDDTESLLPDLILLDIKMPIMDGLQALKIIKQNMAFRHVPTMIVSTSEYSLDIEKGYQYGANSYIVKPFDYTDFARKICEVSRFWVDISEPPKT
ncbi:MAG: response regulator [Alteromonadaceae bacterium]|uniref:response regulator n=1 Tax=Paraglaciecola chathamensis TaxID=368405 RepID=UPI000C629FA8|nr:response regulator [Paraglaciecola agarilytica]MBN25576.1 response regulator [Alteromonadaceae bacterium]|tara:strand:- start:116192 stop:116626 length:435 start_codon:yes stop_codon:yes gene_type:complete